jgi:hypothetical protein
MTIVNINEKWRIQIDELNHTLEKYNEGGVSPFISRPTEPKQCPEWKIKHIKADDYKCGRDVALTILYKDVGGGHYEYKYAICNKTDMFSRKKGVEVALSKQDTWRMYCNNKFIIRTIAYHMLLSSRLSDEACDLLLTV